MTDRRPEDEAAPTPEELREAEALAQALDGEAADDAPGDALETAGLLRHATDSELPPDRAQSVLERALTAAAGADGVGDTATESSEDTATPDGDAGVNPAETSATEPAGDATGASAVTSSADTFSVGGESGNTPATRRAWRRWAAPAATLAAAAAVLLVFWPAAKPPATPLPKPDAKLLHVQALAAQGGATEAALLQTRMRRYREDLLVALANRYAGPR